MGAVREGVSKGALVRGGKAAAGDFLRFYNLLVAISKGRISAAGENFGF